MEVSVAKKASFRLIPRNFSPGRSGKDDNEVSKDQIVSQGDPATLVFTTFRRQAQAHGDFEQGRKP
jgi:hypothetical protein